MSARRIGALALVASVALAGAAAASDGGSGTYTVRAKTYDFVFLNTGSAAWQYFYVVGPRGTAFVGGGTISESSPRCAVGEPDGSADEIECGPLGANLAPPLVHLGFTATVAAPVPCGAPFQLYVSSTGVAPFTRADDLVFTGSCAATAPHALAPPTISGTPVVGHTLTARAAAWSSPPSRVSYGWQRCKRTTCSAIRGATRLRLKLTKPDAGRTVRVVAKATVDGATVISRSGKVAVHR